MAGVTSFNATSIITLSTALWLSSPYVSPGVESQIVNSNFWKVPSTIPFVRISSVDIIIPPSSAKVTRSSLSSVPVPRSTIFSLVTGVLYGAAQPSPAALRFETL